MLPAIDGKGEFGTPDGLDIRVRLAIVIGDGAPRLEIASVQSPADRVSIQAIDRAAKLFLLEITNELRRQAYRARPFAPDPKPKDRKPRRRA